MVDPDQLKKVIEDVCVNGGTICGATEKQKVLYSILHNHLKKNDFNVDGSGGRTALTSHEEGLIAKMVQEFVDNCLSLR